MKWGAIIAAAGRGTRFGRPKQLLEVAGTPLVAWCMRTFAQLSEIIEVVVVTERDLFEPMERLAKTIFSVPISVIEGGATRQESVAHGLAVLSEECEAVFVHDGARPLVRAIDVRAGMNEVREGRAALLASPAIDTMKLIDPKARLVQQTIERETLWGAQTPQFAMIHDLRMAHARAHASGITVTDEAALLERIGLEVIVVPATGNNMKVTRPEDLAIIEALLSSEMLSDDSLRSRRTGSASAAVAQDVRKAASG